MNKPERMPGFYNWNECMEYAFDQGFGRSVIEGLWDEICGFDPPTNGSVFSIEGLAHSNGVSPEVGELVKWLIKEFDTEFFVSW